LSAAVSIESIQQLPVFIAGFPRQVIAEIPLINISYYQGIVVHDLGRELGKCCHAPALAQLLTEIFLQSCQ
jgi:hypothetical protein